MVLLGVGRRKALGFPNAGTSTFLGCLKVIFENVVVLSWYSWFED
jgi:hypothetical protein